MAGFEATLQANVAVAFFVPGIVYLADAIGTQSEAIAVRGIFAHPRRDRPLARRRDCDRDARRRNVGPRFLLPILLVFGDARLAAAVSAAIFFAGAMASAIGFALPLASLSRRDRDPAYGSGPVATVIQDILSLLVYFAVLRAFGI